MILGRLVIVVVAFLFVAWLVGRLMRDRTGR